MKSLCNKQKWENQIYEIQVTDPVHGGSPSLFAKKGVANIPHLQLANRTYYLKNESQKICSEIYEAKLGYESLSDKLESMISDKKKKPIVIANRGFGDLLPENTLAAFSHAIDMEHRHLHADLNISSDNMPIIFGHDNLGTYTDVTGLTCAVCYCDIKVATYNTCNSWRDKSLHIPTLEKFLQLVSSQAEKIYLDIRRTRSTSKVVNYVLPLLRKYGVESNTVLITESIYQIEDIRDDNKVIELALMTDKIVYKQGRNIKVNYQMIDDLRNIGRTSIIVGKSTYLCVFKQFTMQHKYNYLQEVVNGGVDVILDRDQFNDYEVQLAIRAGLTKFLSKSDFSLENKSM